MLMSSGQQPHQHQRVRIHAACVDHPDQIVCDRCHGEQALARGTPGRAVARGRVRRARGDRRLIPHPSLTRCQDDVTGRRATSCQHEQRLASPEWMRRCVEPGSARRRVEPARIDA